MFFRNQQTKRNPDKNVDHSLRDAAMAIYIYWMLFKSCVRGRRLDFPQTIQTTQASQPTEAQNFGMMRPLKWNYTNHRTPKKTKIRTHVEQGPLLSLSVVKKLSCERRENPCSTCVSFCEFVCVRWFGWFRLRESADPKVLVAMN